MKIAIANVTPPEATLPVFATDIAGTLYLLHRTHTAGDATLWALDMTQDGERIKACTLELTILPRGTQITFEV